MTTSKYGPTPPTLSASKNGNNSLTKPDGGVLTTFTQEVMEMVVTHDAAPVDLCRYAVMKDRTFQVQVFVEAYDAAGGRSASGASLQQVTRLGAGPVEDLVGTPVFLSYTPIGDPLWDSSTVTALLTKDGNDIVVRCIGIAGDVRWRATLKIIGSQAQIVT